MCLKQKKQKLSIKLDKSFTKFNNQITKFSSFYYLLSSL